MPRSNSAIINQLAVTPEIRNAVSPVSEAIQWNCDSALAICRDMLVEYSDYGLLAALDTAIIAEEGAEFMQLVREGRYDFGLIPDYDTSANRMMSVIGFVTELMTDVNLHSVCESWCGNVVAITTNLFGSRFEAQG